MSDRLQREIEDIVEKAGADSLPPPPRRSRRVSRPRPTEGRRRSPFGGLKYVAILVIVLLIAGALLWGVAGSLAGWLALGTLILFGAAYLSYFRNGGSTTTLPGGYEKRWRGQTVYEEPNRPSFFGRLFNRRKRNR